MAELLRTAAEELLDEARRIRDTRSRLVTYSPKVFIPLTKLCRDVCHYCTFAAPPKRGEHAYLTIEEALEIARAGAATESARENASVALEAKAMLSSRQPSSCAVVA